MKIPLATPLRTRVGDTTKDARLKNAYAEVRGDQSVVRHRPSARGGVDVATGTAQGGIGFNISGTDYFIGFWADTMTPATGLSGFSNNWSATTSYIGGDFIYTPDETSSDPFNPAVPSRTKQYAQGSSLDKSPSLFPALWSPVPYTPATWSANAGGITTSDQPDIGSVIQYYVDYSSGLWIPHSASYINETQVYFEFHRAADPETVTNWGIATKA